MSPLGDFTLQYLVPDWDPYPCFEHRVRDDTRCYAAKRLGDFADVSEVCYRGVIRSPWPATYWG